MLFNFQQAYQQFAGSCLTGTIVHLKCYDWSSTILFQYRKNAQNLPAKFFCDITYKLKQWMQASEKHR